MSEFRQIVKDTLIMHSHDNDSQVINMTSEVSQDLLAKEIENRIKTKFHVLRKHFDSDAISCRIDVKRKKNEQRNK